MARSIDRKVMGPEPPAAPTRNPKALRSLLYKLAGPNLERYFLVLHNIAMGRRKANASTQLRALEILIERVFGKAPVLNLNANMEMGDGHGPFDLSDPRTRELALEYTRRLADLLGKSGSLGDVREPREVEALPALGSAEPAAPGPGGG